MFLLNSLITFADGTLIMRLVTLRMTSWRQDLWMSCSPIVQEELDLRTELDNTFMMLSRLT